MTGFKAVVIGELIDHDASKVQGTAYFDKSSTPAQREAFTEMLAFRFGWNPPHIVGSKVVFIDFKEAPDKNTYTLIIPDILEEKGVMKRDSAGKPLNVVPAMDLWGNKTTYLENVVFKYHDKGVGEWDLERVPHHERHVGAEETSHAAWRHVGDMDRRTERYDQADGMKPE